MKKTLKTLVIILALGIGYLGAKIDMGKYSKNYFLKNYLPQAQAQQAFAYYYPQVTRCYRFNIFLRVNAAFGFDPVSVSDVQVDGIWKTVIQFENQLSAGQETTLNAIFADNPEFPPSNVGTKYEAMDVYENRAVLAGKFGLSFQTYYSCAGDRIFVFFSNTLSQGQKNNVANQFSTLLTEKSVITP